MQIRRRTQIFALENKYLYQDKKIRVLKNLPNYIFASTYVRYRHDA